MVDKDPSLVDKSTLDVSRRSFMRRFGKTSLAVAGSAFELTTLSNGAGYTVGRFLGDLYTGRTQRSVDEADELIQRLTKPKDDELTAERNRAEYNRMLLFTAQRDIVIRALRFVVNHPQEHTQTTSVRSFICARPGTEPSSHTPPTVLDFYAMPHEDAFGCAAVQCELYGGSDKTTDRRVVINALSSPDLDPAIKQRLSKIGELDIADLTALFEDERTMYETTIEYPNERHRKVKTNDLPSLTDTRARMAAVVEFDNEMTHAANVIGLNL